jgi:hypothetical protein
VLLQVVTLTCLRAHTREDAEFYPAENVFGSQPVLPGQFLLDLESPSPSLLADFQVIIAGCTPLPTAHHALPAPSSLPEELLLARFVLVLRDGVHPPLSPAYDGPFAVLEWSSHFFKLQMGPRADTVLVHHLKPCRAPEDTPVAVPPHHSGPTASAPPPIVAPLPVTPKEPVSHRPSTVTFAFPEAVPDLRPSPAFHPSGRPAPSVRLPERYPP